MGIIKEVGEEVPEFKAGDKVTAVGGGGIPKNFVSHLFGIDVDDKKLELARKFGADTILHPTSVDVVNCVKIHLGDVDYIKGVIVY